MALRFIDGFDHYNAYTPTGYKYNEVGSNLYLAMDTGRRSGSGAIRLYSASGYVGKILDDQSTWIVGAAVKVAAMPSGVSPLFAFRDNTSNTQVCLCLTSTGTLALYRGNATTLLAASTNAIITNAWNFIEAKITIADSGGAFEARVNGEVWTTYTGDTKYPSTLATANSIRICGMPSAAQVWYDDLYICDGTGSANNTYLGDVRVDTLYPTGTGASAQFTPTGSANNWDNVDDASPDDDATYNASGTAGNIDSFAFSDLSALSSTIFGVQTNAIARKDDAGTRVMRVLASLGGTNYESPDLSLGDSYVDCRCLWEKNPATLAAWAESEINAAEFGYKVQS